MNNIMEPLEIAEKETSFLQKTVRNGGFPIWQRKPPSVLPFSRLSAGSSLKGRETLVILTSVLLSALAMLLLPAGSLYAQGLGLTGNFYRYGFELAPGETSAGIEAYIIVINNNAAPVRVKIDTNTPPGVTIALPETDFVLEAGGQKKLDAVVEVDKKTIPGEYKITISATPFREGEGIKISGGGMQRATLKVLKPGMSPLTLAGIIVGSLLILAGVVWLLVKRRR